jgi:hypothetical protein
MPMGNGETLPSTGSSAGCSNTICRAALAKFYGPPHGERDSVSSAAATSLTLACFRRRIVLCPVYHCD